LFSKFAVVTITVLFAIVFASFWGRGCASRVLGGGKLIPPARTRLGEACGTGDFALHRHSVSRSLFVFVAITSTVALAGCYSETTAPVTERHMQPLSERIVANLESRNMEKGSPILVRIFKEESELEVWKIDHTGRFALLRTYPICRWLSLRPRRLAGVSFGRLQTKNARRTRWLAGHLTL
jgi:hypothetical protein